MSDNCDALPPQKRQRTDSNGDPGTRSQYWFEDGNIILQAEDTLFRVHRSVLSRSSQIFKDTFAIPQPPSQENDIDGCPVLPISDAAEDIGNLISLLYDGEKVLNFGDWIPVETLGSMLRLGRKYVIPYLENKALESLHRNFPSKLPDWDLLQTAAREEKLGPKTISEIISIAHEFHLYTIFPAAYATYLQRQFLEKIPSDADLPKKAREHCVIGYARIQGFIKRNCIYASCPPFLPSKECSGRGKCEGNKWGFIRELPIWLTEEDESFGIWEPCHLGAEKLCSRCLAEVKKLTDRVRSDFWALLPTFFGLPPWPDLKDEP